LVHNFCHPLLKTKDLTELHRVIHITEAVVLQLPLDFWNWDNESCSDEKCNLLVSHLASLLSNYVQAWISCGPSPIGYGSAFVTCFSVLVVTYILARKHDLVGPVLANYRIETGFLYAMAPELL